MSQTTRPAAKTAISNPRASDTFATLRNAGKNQTAFFNARASVLPGTLPRLWSFHYRDCGIFITEFEDFCKPVQFYARR
jgi:hypothetical protein